jgi:hypothetical protein
VSFEVESPSIKVGIVFQRLGPFGEGRSFILETMCLINDEIIPRKFAQDTFLNVADLIGRES